MIDNSKAEVYQVMELVQLKEMEQILANRGAFEEKYAKVIFRKIVQSIQYLHENGVCHRDIKVILYSIF